MERLRIEITGDASGIKEASREGVRAIEQFEDRVESSLDNVDDNFTKAADSVEKIGDSARSAEPSLRGFGNQAKNLSNSTNELSGSLINASESMLDIGAGGQIASSAVESVGSAFGGPSGLIVIAGLAVGALVSYIDKVTDTNAANNSLAAEIANVTQILSNYTSVIQGVTRARVEGEVSAQQELVNLRLLRDAAEDTTLSTEDRLKAVNELQRVYPAYFGNLDEEKILQGQLSGVYDTLTESILNRARATASTNLLVANAERELLINQRLLAIQERLAELNENSNRPGVVSQRTGTRSAGGLNPLEAIELSRLRSEGEELGEELSRIIGENIDLTEFLADNGGVVIDPPVVPPPVIEPLRPQVAALPLLIEPDLTIDNSISDDIASGITDVIDTGFTLAQARLQVLAEQFNARINQSIEASLVNGITDIGSSIGEALANGGSVIDAIGSSLIQSLGSFVSNMGALLIEYGTLAVLKGGLDLAILTGGPAAILAGTAAIAVGVALSAAGSAISTAATNQGNPTSGTASTGGTPARQAAQIPSSSGLGGTVVFEIAGTKLVGVLNRTLDRNLALRG